MSSTTITIGHQYFFGQGVNHFVEPFLPLGTKTYQNLSKTCQNHSKTTQKHVKTIKQNISKPNNKHIKNIQNISKPSVFRVSFFPKKQTVASTCCLRLGLAEDQLGADLRPYLAPQPAMEARERVIQREIAANIIHFGLGRVKPSQRRPIASADLQRVLRFYRDF